MIVYPRQRLYDISHAGFASAAASGRLNDSCDGNFAEAFSELIGSPTPIVPLGRGRLSLYFATRNRVTAERSDVLICPFTIFDMVNMIVCGGGRPRFIDSEPGGPHVSLKRLREHVDDRTALVVIIHYHTVNPEIREIAAFLRERGVALLEDAAISLGGRVDGQHVGTFGDYGLFSFGLFKFIATYYGGAIWVRDEEERKSIASELSTWPKMNTHDLLPYAKKGMKFSALTQPAVFNLLTFPLFRFGYLHNIHAIKKQAINDPAPRLTTALPDGYKRRPSDFQIRDWRRQLDGVLEARRQRLQRAERYAARFANSNSVRNSHPVNPQRDCFLNYPINVDQPEAVLGDIMRRGFDASPYFYRNCARLDCFNDYAVDLPNIDAYANDMVVLPTYPGLPLDYVDALAEAVVEAANARETPA